MTPVAVASRESSCAYLPHDAMLARYNTVVLCPSVCYKLHSLWYCIETTGRIELVFKAWRLPIASNTVGNLGISENYYFVLYYTNLTTRTTTTSRDF